MASDGQGKEREKIGRARAAAAGVKKPPVEAPKSVTGCGTEAVRAAEILNFIDVDFA